MPELNNNAAMNAMVAAMESMSDNMGSLSQNELDAIHQSELPSQTNPMITASKSNTDITNAVNEASNLLNMSIDMVEFNLAQALVGNQLQFNNNGTLISNATIKFINHSVTSTASTTKTVNIASYGLTTLFNIQATTTKPGVDNTTMPIVHIVSATPTQIQYMLVQSKTTGVLIGGSVEGLEYDTSTNCTVNFLIIAI